MTIDEVKKYFGSGYKYEKITGRSHTNFIAWRRAGYIPILTQNKLEKITGGGLKADYIDGEGSKDVNKE